jgi:hypothetical protein
MVQSRKTATMIVIVTVVAAALGVAGVMPALSQATGGEAGNAPAASLSTVAEAITYQGRLTGSGGSPLSGDFTMQFILYNAPTGGTALFNSGQQTVSVANGLFTVSLPVPQSLFDGQALWLSITVEGQTLSPRQPVTPTTYAMSLRPGATVTRDSAGSGFTVRNVATGTAVRAEANHIALYGESANFAVYGSNSGGPQGSGYGGYFESTTGIGVHGRSSALPATNNQLVPGVSGSSQHGVGVYGTSNSPFAAGVFGDVATGTGTHGSSGGIGAAGIGRAYGVYGSNSGVAQGAGYGGYFESTTGVGVHGRSTAVPTGTNLYAPGVYGYSQHGAAIYGQAGASNVAGYFEGNLIVQGDINAQGNLTVTGSKSGYVVDIARNDGSEPLEQGDLVIVTGAGDPVLGNIPVPLVRKADSEASTAVIGVVDSAYHFGGDGYGQFADGPAGPGDYLSIVTLGSFRAVKVDAAYGAIQPGDLLVSSPTPGHAMRATTPAPGTIVGKALAPLESGTGNVAIMVTLQ